MTNYYLGAILIMLIAIYWQAELRELSKGRPKSVTGFVCAIAAPLIIIVGAITH